MQIAGSNNAVTNLLNVNPQAGVAVNALNSVTQTASGVAGAGRNNIGSGQVSKLATTYRNKELTPLYSLISKNLVNTAMLVKGSDYTVSSLPNANPQVSTDVNALNTAKQEGAAGAGAIDSPGNNIGSRQIRKYMKKNYSKVFH